MNKLQGKSSIKLGGKTLKVVLNMNAFHILTEEFGIQLEDLEKTLSGFILDSDGKPELDENGEPKQDNLKIANGLAMVGYCGVVNAYDLQGVEFDMPWRQFKALFMEDLEEGPVQDIGELLAKVFNPPSENTDSGNE